MSLVAAGPPASPRDEVKPAGAFNQDAPSRKGCQRSYPVLEQQWQKLRQQQWPQQSQEAHQQRPQLEREVSPFLTRGHSWREMSPRDAFLARRAPDCCEGGKRQDKDLPMAGQVPRVRRFDGAGGSLPRSPREVWESCAAPSGVPGPSIGGGNGAAARTVRQALNRSSILSEKGVYSRASKPFDWEVSKMHVSMLPGETDERSLASICRAFGHQVVEVTTTWDPIKNRCSGDATVLLRTSKRASAADTCEPTAGLKKYLEKKVGCVVR